MMESAEMKAIVEQIAAANVGNAAAMMEALNAYEGMTGQTGHDLLCDNDLRDKDFSKNADAAENIYLYGEYEPTAELFVITITDGSVDFCTY